MTDPPVPLGVQKDSNVCHGAGTDMHPWVNKFSMVKSYQLTTMWRCRYPVPTMVARVGLTRNGLPASRFRDMWQIWDGQRKTYFSVCCFVLLLVKAESWHFFPFKKVSYRQGQNVMFFGKDVTKNVTSYKKYFRVRERHILPRNVTKCGASHFLSTGKVTNVTWLTQIWDGKLGRNPGNTDPNAGVCVCVALFCWPDIGESLRSRGQFLSAVDLGWPDPHPSP